MTLIKRLLITALPLFFYAGPMYAQVSPLANTRADAPSANQNRLTELVRDNPLNTAEGRRIFDELLDAIVRAELAKAGKQAGMGTEWSPQHLVWQEIEVAQKKNLSDFLERMIFRLQSDMSTALAGFSNDELDAELRVRRSPLGRRVGETNLASLRAMVSAIGGDTTDIQAQERVLRDVLKDPEFSAYLSSSLGKKMLETNAKVLQAYVADLVAQASLARTEIALRVAQYQGKGDAELSTLRNSRLFDLAASNDVGRLRQELALGADPRVRDTRPGKRNETLLHVSARQSDSALLGTLFDLGLTDLIDTLDGNQATPLRVAVMANRLANARLLVDHGANVNAVSPTGSTALHGAALQGDRAMIEFLLDRGATDTSGTTLRNLAVSRDASNRTYLISKFLALGADVAQIAGDGMPAYSAVASSSEELALMLLDRVPKRVRDALSYPPLVTACIYSHQKVVGRLLAEGTNIEALDPYGRTALLVLLQRRQPSEAHRAMTDLLIKRGADPGVRDKAGRNAVDFAAADGTPGFETHVDRLISLGLLADTAGPNGKTPLHHAVNEASVKKLVVLGASPDAQDKDGNTPLHAAILGNRPGAVKGLLATGARLDVRNGSGDTPAAVAEALKIPAQRDAMLKLLASAKRDT